MIYCPSCGSKNEEGEILCGECGAKLKGPVKPVSPIVPAEPVKPVIPAESEKPAETVTSGMGPDPADTPVNPAKVSGDWHEVSFAAEDPKPHKSLGSIVLIVIFVMVALYGIIAALIDATKHRPIGVTLESYAEPIEVFEEDGQKMKKDWGMNLYDNSSVRTGDSGEAYLSLGAARSLEMLAKSEIQVHKAEEATWITVKKGAMFFCIDNPYRQTETLELDAGAVSVSMSEASGYMYYDGNGKAMIWLMNGEVQIVVYDEGSGEQIMETLSPGERAVGTFGDDGISCTVDKVLLDDLPSLMVRKIAESPALLNRVSPDTGWTRPDIIDLAEQYRAEEMELNFLNYSWLLDTMNEEGN